MLAGLLLASPLLAQPAPPPVPVGECDGEDPPPSCLRIFTLGFPHGFFFRNPEHPTGFQSYLEWQATFGRLDGIIIKTVQEELANLPPNTIDYAAHFAAAREDQLVMLHFNGNAMDPYWQRPAGSFVHQRFSAGHWLYFPGSSLTANVTADNNDNWISVSDVSAFRDNIGFNNANKGDDIVLVRLNGTQKLWQEAEHMTIQEIDAANSRLRVTRGHFSNSPPLSFVAGQTYVAPHVPEGPWGPTTNNLLWQYNFSTTCPLDSSGRNAGNVLAEVLDDFLNPDGAPGPDGRDYHGVQFDLAPWWKDALIEGRIADVDNDNVADGGILEDRNEYGRGVYQFFTDLRQVLGDDRLIVADGGESFQQRALGPLNGMEAEGFSGFNDSTLDNWSSAVNRLSYWRDHAGHSPRLNYVVHKDPASVHPPENVSRLVLAASQILGLPVTTLVDPGPERGHSVGIWDELRKGDEELYHWLGFPRGTIRQPDREPQRLALDAPDLLLGAGERLDPDFVDAWSSDDATIVNLGNELQISAIGNCTGSGARTCMTVHYSGLAVPAGDLTIFFEVRADPLDGFTVDVPREVTVRALGQQPQAPTTQALRTYAGSTYFSSSFFLRDAGPATINLELEIEGGGSLYLRNFTAHNAADALARDFQGGAVIANPSLNALDFDMEQMFPGRSYRRLRASALQNAAHNHGGSQPQTDSLSPLDGLFLVHDLEPTSRFIATPSAATGPVTVQFTDQSLAVTKDQAWDFGDGSPIRKCEPSCSPTHQYTDRGYYTVKLTSRNDFGRQAERSEGHIVIGDLESFVASTDFSSTQGSDNWFYFGWDGSYKPLVFFDGGWRWDPESASESSWTQVFQNHDHPHHADSARAWRSPKHGTVRVTGKVKKSDVGGDGVTASIFLDDRWLAEWQISGDDTNKRAFDFEQPIRQGQTLYFRVHMNGDPFDDLTVWEDLTIDLIALDLPQVDFAVHMPSDLPTRASFDNRTTCLPGEVPCSDPLSETRPARWAWDYDSDGRVDSWREDGFSYFSAPGSYDIRLQVENDAGWAELVKPDAVVFHPPPVQVWVASADFSSIQGQNQWRYFEWNGAGFYQPLQWDVDHWQGTATWTQIHPNNDHPDFYPVARAWQAPWAGSAHIEGQVRLTNPQGCGDGVRAFLFHNNTVIGGPYHLAAGDSIGLPIDVIQSVTAGDFIIFRTHSNANVSCDSTSWSQSITLTP